MDLLQDWPLRLRLQPFLFKSPPWQLIALLIGSVHCNCKGPLGYFQSVTLMFQLMTCVCKRQDTRAIPLFSFSTGPPPTLSVIDNCKLVKNTLSGIFGSMVCERASCLENYRDKKLSGKLFMLWNRSVLVFGGDCPWCGNRLNNPDIKNRRHWALWIFVWPIPAAAFGNNPNLDECFNQAKHYASTSEAFSN